MNPYNHSAIQQANHYYSLIHEYRNQLDKLEALHKDIFRDEALKKYYSDREKEREEEEKNSKRNLIMILIISFVLLILAILGNIYLEY